MIYPQKLNNKKSTKLINILLINTFILGTILVLINKLTTPNIHWAAIANSGIIYVWITVIFALKRNTNIAKHILLQMIITSFVIYYIDQKLNFYGWSITIGIPVIIIVANIAMLVLSIIGHKNYVKYALYQLIIVFLSVLQVAIILNGRMQFKILNIIALGISIFNFIVSLILSYKEFYKMIMCKFHM